jgi:hypothetical protein
MDTLGEGGRIKGRLGKEGRKTVKGRVRKKESKKEGWSRAKEEER